jgi:hypothetical protein
MEFSGSIKRQASDEQCENIDETEEESRCWAMAHLSPRSTGVPEPVNIWISDGGCAPYCMPAGIGPCVRFGVRREIPQSVCTIADSPELVGELQAELSQDHLVAVKKWVALNCESLLLFWSNTDGETCSTPEVCKLLKKI